MMITLFRAKRSKLLVWSRVVGAASRRLSNLLLWPTIPILWAIVALNVATAFNVAWNWGGAEGYYYLAVASVLTGAIYVVPPIAWFFRLIYCILQDDLSKTSERYARGWVLRLAALFLPMSLFAVVLLYGRWSEFPILAGALIMFFPDIVVIA